MRASATDTDMRPDMRDVIGHYDRHGRAWAALRGDRPAEGEWIDRFAAPLAPPLAPVATIIDIGCGSGVPIAAGLAARGFAVTGIDGSETMLALFRRNLPGVPARRVDMRGLALGRRFDGLVAWDSFFHLGVDDQRAMFPRFAAHAAPGASLLFTSGDREGEAIGRFEGEPLFHASLAPDEYRALLADHGFAVRAHAANDPSCGHRTVWLARYEGR